MNGRNRSRGREGGSGEGREGGRERRETGRKSGRGSEGEERPVGDMDDNTIGRNAKKREEGGR